MKKMNRARVMVSPRTSSANRSIIDLSARLIASKKFELEAIRLLLVIQFQL